MHRVFIIFLSVLALMAVEPIRARAQENADEVNPLYPALSDEAQPTPARTNGFAALFDDASLTLRSTYYGRSRDADNARNANKAAGEIHVNAFGQGVDFRSGYAWDMIGFDVTGQTNLGRGNGNSEVLYYKYAENKDRSSVALGQAAVKTKFGTPDFGFEARGGFTPISIGSLGTSGGLHSHAYRGVEAKAKVGSFWIGYGWADQFRNEWDHTFRYMYPSWDQNRRFNNAPRITYAHSIGARYEFGRDNAGFVDIGVGEGRRYRKNVQIAAAAPIDLGRLGVLTLTGYGLVARYERDGVFDFGGKPRKTEYHVSGSARLERGDWTFMGGLGHTRAPNSDEMQFRLTAWGSSDNRNFIQTWGQLDDFVWDGQSVVKLQANYKIGDKIGLPGLSVGCSYLYGWNAANPGRADKSRGWELDYQVEYAFGEETRLKGLAMGVYAGHLRYGDNNFHGKQNRNDVKVIVSYSKTLEHFLRWRK